MSSTKAASATNGVCKQEGADQAAFKKHLFTIAAYGQVSLAISLGSTAGLFKALAKVGSTAKPASAEAVAKEAGAKPRYVKEWLGCMACADVIEVDTSGKVGGLNLWSPFTATPPPISAVLDPRVASPTDPRD